ncbi:MAG: radical SAM protein [Chloroflexi bacterium]|nr:radical SAM protein [Chloroflexota bacterium]
MESIYWAFTHRCNQYCSHCYNHSRPGGPSITADEADAVLRNIPQPNRLILSGGEPLVEKELLLHILTSATQRFGNETRLALQTNGDLLDERTLDELLDAGVQSMSIASQDAYHAKRTGLRERLTALLTGRGLREVDVGDPSASKPQERTFSFWGATPDLWLGGLWARGRALRNDISLRDPDHNFCSLWSGALGFLDDGSSRQEIAIQLTKVYPCCPGTVEPLGDIAEEPLEAILDRHRGEPMWEALNRGEPAEMGIAAGVDQEFARKRIKELGNVCLWCDEYFTKYRDVTVTPTDRNTATQSWPDDEPRPQPLALVGELADG